MDNKELVTVQSLMDQVSPYERWKGEVYEQIETLAEVCTSDAQGIAEAKADLLDDCWQVNMQAAETAKLILG